MRSNAVAALLVSMALISCGDREPPPPPLPPDRVEVAPPPPGEAYVWERGHWAWRRGAYVWIPGHYMARPYATSVWVPGHYRRTRWGSEYVAGHWR